MPGPVTRPTSEPRPPLGTPSAFGPRACLPSCCVPPPLAVSYQLPEPRDNRLGSLTPFFPSLDRYIVGSTLLQYLIWP